MCESFQQLLINIGFITHVAVFDIYSWQTSKQTTGNVKVIAYKQSTLEQQNVYECY